MALERRLLRKKEEAEGQKTKNLPKLKWDECTKRSLKSYDREFL